MQSSAEILVVGEPPPEVFALRDELSSDGLEHVGVVVLNEEAPAELPGTHSLLRRLMRKLAREM
jgi:hypothetical protein